MYKVVSESSQTVVVTASVKEDERGGISSMKNIAEQSMSSHTIRISYGVCEEILTENLNMHCSAPSSRQCTCPHISLKTREFVTSNNMVIVPQPPYSLPCDFIWFPKLKMKLKG
jgi:hypothetical protein